MLPVYINTALGSLLVLLVLLIDYIHKSSTDNYQRKLFILVIGSSSTAVVLDLTGRILSGAHGAWVPVAMYSSISLFLIAWNCAYYLTAVLVDYIANKNIEKTKILINILYIFIVMYSASVIFNFQYKYYFFITDENQYLPGKLFSLRLPAGIFAIIVILINILSAIKQFRFFHIRMIVFFLALNAVGVGIDTMQNTGSLTWPCFTAALLYLYFFSIQFDSKLDTLTGLGNRHSFNEFIGKLSKKNKKADYSIVKINLDRFKQINDSLGRFEGDNALKDMAVIITGCIRHTDFVARYGGDKFVLATRAENDIQRIMGRIQDAIDIHNKNNNRLYTLCISYGYGVFTTNSRQSMRKFMDHVDSLLNKQKEEHRRQLAEKD
jgi:diguanylate cyclase (GGDEF)-like protein